MDNRNSEQQVILFDGVCNLCNSSIQFIIRHDKKARFKFASLQSDAGKNTLQRFNQSNKNLYSVLLIRGDQCFDRSRAALEIANKLDGLWPMLYLFILVPPFIRDFIYDWISRNRYKWFGVRNECMIPTPGLKSRFLS